ncbi:YcgN family cysteine cluster protein [Prosthecomicrobium sp. N25]|uniref:YcgN family cysteine cluster protein n=1 Tax=Prosthecomicrobium sp. N25 TaxID=3129254 RepID=UPI0030780C2B
MTGQDRPFWRAKRLDEMTPAEWESLCDGCGRCCLHKLEEEETGDIYWTDVACRLLDSGSCRCSSYEDRHDFVPDCVVLDPREVVEQTYTWLPPTCAYRLLANGDDLYWWHPLVSGDPETVHAAGISVRDRVVSEEDYGVEDLEDRVVDWPGEIPVVPPPPPVGKRRR